jgi:hypothetical protein
MPDYENVFTGREAPFGRPAGEGFSRAGQRRAGCGCAISTRTARQSRHHTPTTLCEAKAANKTGRN